MLFKLSVALLYASASAFPTTLGRHRALSVDPRAARIARLQAIDPRQARIVELRFLAGLTYEEIANVLGISARTARLDWQMARAWLRQELEAPANDA